MEITKDNLKKLSLQELKILAKSYKVLIGGTKTQIIKRLLDHTRPEPVVVHSHPASLSPLGRKIVGAKTTEGDKLRQLGQQVEKKYAFKLYYSMGVHYFEVDKEFEFI
jgi:hypothetical protein